MKDVEVVANKHNVMGGQLLVLCTAQIMIFTEASKIGWEAHIGLQILPKTGPPRQLQCYSIKWLELEDDQISTEPLQAPGSPKC